jgi:propanol-preferring alcohol dehydrogenase
MRALRLSAQSPLSTSSLPLVDLPIPTPNSKSVLLRVRACGVCHTDLHIVEGDLPLRKSPITIGHQVVGVVEKVGGGVTQCKVGERVGVPWLHTTCGVCEFCKRGEENLCDGARFTGWDVDGGYAEYMVAHQDSVVRIPESFSDEAAAPLLCAGIIGYRSLIKADVKEGERTGLFGFGASAHIAIQIARYWNCQVYVFTRSEHHRAQARSLGAAWAGGAGESAPLLDRVIIFAPAGSLIPIALSHLRKGGTLAINAIHTSPIPQMDYSLLYGERTVRSVANATRDDALKFMSLADRAKIKTEVTTFELEEANVALMKLKRGEINGAAVLKMSV